jgi:ribonuclease P protein component
MERRVRLRRTKDVERTFHEGKSWSHPLVRLVARRNGLERSRVGVTASRRVGGAVARARAKRLLRESARRLYSQLGSGWDLMLVARPGLPEEKQPRIEEALALLLEEAGVTAEGGSPHEGGGIRAKGSVG